MQKLIFLLLLLGLFVAFYIYHEKLMNLYEYDTPRYQHPHPSYKKQNPELVDDGYDSDLLDDGNYSEFTLGDYSQSQSQSNEPSNNESQYDSHYESNDVTYNSSLEGSNVTEISEFSDMSNVY